MYRPNTLQIRVAHVNSGLSAKWEGKVDGFDMSFNIEPREDRPQSTTRIPHPYNGAVEGPYFGPDAMHDCSHAVECRRKFGGLDSCSQLTGVNLNAHEQNHSKTNIFLSMLNTMSFGRIHVDGYTRK